MRAPLPSASTSAPSFTPPLETELLGAPPLYGWRREFIAGGKERLARRRREQDSHAQEIAELKALVVEFTVANRLLKKLSES